MIGARNVYVEDIDAIASELENLEVCTRDFLSDYTATELDGESALHRRETGIHTSNMTAASEIPAHDSFNYIHSSCAKMLKANDFSMIATARHPRANLTSYPVIRYADLKAMSSELKSCRAKMKITLTPSQIVGPTTRPFTTPFRYDPTIAGYIVNLPTRGLAPGSYNLQFTVSGADTTTHVAPFTLR